MAKYLCRSLLTKHPSSTYLCRLACSIQRKALISSFRPGDPAFGSASGLQKERSPGEFKGKQNLMRIYPTCLVEIGIMQENFREIYY